MELVRESPDDSKGGSDGDFCHFANRWRSKERKLIESPVSLTARGG